MQKRPVMRKVSQIYLAAGLIGISSTAVADGPDLVAYFKNTNSTMRLYRFSDITTGVKNIGNRVTPSGTCIRVDLTISNAKIDSMTGMNAFRACDGNSFASQGVAGCQIRSETSLRCEWDPLGPKDIPGDTVHSNDEWELQVSIYPNRRGGTSWKVEADRPNRIREDGRETNIGVIPMTIL